MGVTNTEKLISEINRNIFFSEFTFSKNDFKSPDTNQQLELADSVVWLDDMLFIIQIKDRVGSSEDDIKWYENKVLRKGVKQIKSTLKYFQQYPEIILENERGHKLNVSEAKESAVIHPIIVYTPNLDFPNKHRFKKFHNSSEAGLIHLFHSEDYYWICKYLITPAEIDEYLGFRVNFYTSFPIEADLLPEQYILGHFFETLNTDHINLKYINNISKLNSELQDFDISFLMDNFSSKLELVGYQTEYYYIIKQIAKLNRSELYEFKKRFLRTVEKCGSEEIIYPYRIYIPRTDCAFVFIPLHHTRSTHWKTALYNLALAQKYDQRAGKCVGVLVFRDPIDQEYFQIFWTYMEGEWEYDEVIEKKLKDNYPFREVKMNSIDNRYKDPK